MRTGSSTTRGDRSRACDGPGRGWETAVVCTASGGSPWAARGRTRCHSRKGLVPCPCPRSSASTCVDASVDDVENGVAGGAEVEAGAGVAAIRSCHERGMSTHTCRIVGCTRHRSMKPPEEGERQSPQPKEGSQAPYKTEQSAR